MRFSEWSSYLTIGSKACKTYHQYLHASLSHIRKSFQSQRLPRATAAVLWCCEKADVTVSTNEQTRQRECAVKYTVTAGRRHAHTVKDTFLCVVLFFLLLQSSICPLLCFCLIKTGLEFMS